MKDQTLKKISLLALAGLLFVSKSPAISLDDIPLWTGSGTNRAALVIEWSTPESLTYSSVPAPVADKTMTWGYRFNGTVTAAQMFNAIVAANPSLYAVEYIDPTYGPGVQAIGFNLQGGGPAGVTDGTVTDLANTFTNGILIDPNLDVDAAYSLNSGDLYWGGHYGPNWETWNELGDEGGFENSPNRGTNEFWTITDPIYYSSGTNGQWELAQNGLGFLPLTNGSWIGFSVAAGEYEPDEDAPYNLHKHAPVSPDGTYVAYVCNTNDFATQIISTNNLDAGSALYGNPAAVLGRPTLRFLDGAATNRVSIIDDPYDKSPAGADIITEIKSGGQITVELGRKVYDNPNNPYGIDLIVYGNSFFEGLAGLSGAVSDAADLSVASLTSSAVFGHATTVSVSPDGVNWYTYPNTPVLFPDQAYRWDDTNDSWTAEQLNPTKPLNPFIYTNNFGGQSIAGALDQFAGAAGGTGYDLRESGFPWIQYVQIQPGPGVATVIDAIAAVNPVVVGDALAITPDNLAAGLTNLDFQNPANPGQNLIALGFAAVSTNARVSTVALSEFSAYAPVVGNVSSAYKIRVQPLSGPGPVTCLANVGLRPGVAYTGTGGDLRVYQWNGTDWTSQPFTYNPAGGEVLLTGVTNFSALAVTQIVPPQLSIQNQTNSYAFRFTPVPNAAHTLQRSTDLIHWTTLTNLTPSSILPVALQDNAAPADRAFYRLSISVP